MTDQHDEHSDEAATSGTPEPSTTPPHTSTPLTGPGSAEQDAERDAELLAVHLDEITRQTIDGLPPADE